MEGMIGFEKEVQDMDISVIGASGDVGTETVNQLLAGRVLTPSERLQLVGRVEGKSSSKLFGLQSDLSDAYAEVAPELEVVLTPEKIRGDIVILAAGATVTAPNQTRNELARLNLPVFRRYAQAIAAHGHGRELVLVVSNPVELAVEVFSQYLGRHRVIGVGGYSDSLRFRREIAHDLGVRRQLVHAFVVGEHGDNMVPLWSSVRIFGRNGAQAVADVARLRGERVTARFPAEVDEHRTAVMEYLRQGKVREAFDRVDQLPADLRVVLRPYITMLSGAKTSIATANVIVDLVRTLVEGREVVVCGQVRLDGELSDLHVPVGVPVVIDARGWTQVVPLELWADEAQLLARAAEGLRERIRDWLGVQADESAFSSAQRNASS